MESFTLSGASGWQLLSTLLSADVTFEGKYLWSWLYIRNTHASQTVIVKGFSSTSAPSTDSGITLPVAGGNMTWSPLRGNIDGRAIWVKCSGAATTFDISFMRA
jgi:hypothetical protein